MAFCFCMFCEYSRISPGLCESECVSSTLAGLCVGRDASNCFSCCNLGISETDRTLISVRSTSGRSGGSRSLWLREQVGSMVLARGGEKALRAC